MSHYITLYYNIFYYTGTPGYAFESGATSSTPSDLTQHGYPCLPGTFCPPGSKIPTPCPIGTYQSYALQTNISSCVLCDSGTYQYEQGQASCYPCSSSSVSLKGSSLCSCIGKNRAFQPGDGFCICSPGFEFVDSNFVVSSEKDGSYDCQPVVYQRYSVVRFGVMLCVLMW